MANQLFDVCTSRLQIFSGVELVGMLVEELTDGTGHSQTEVRVDVDLTNSGSGSLAELLLGNTDSAGHCTAVLVDHLNVVLGNGGRTVQNDGETGQLGNDLLQDVETQLGVGAGLELVSAVGSADSDSQGVTAGTCDELLDFLGTGVVSVPYARSSLSTTTTGS